MPTMTHMLKPAIQLSKPILFRTFEKDGSTMLTNALSMFEDLDSFSEYLTYGSHQFISRIRIGYVYRKATKKQAVPVTTGGKTCIGGKPKDIQEYMQGLKLLYGKSMPILTARTTQKQYKFNATRSKGKTKYNKTKYNKTYRKSK
jgi:hypothetical protein